MKVVALVPAYNEAESIAMCLNALLAQTHPVTVVVLPNGCTDDTAAIAREFPVEVMEFARLEHKKSEAMNRGWSAHCQDADLVITVDADTELTPTAIEEWVAEFTENDNLAGSCARFTMKGNDFITRLQRMDFAMGIDISLRRGWTCVLAGAASCFRNDVLKQVHHLDDREGPWSYESAVEDFEVTYQTLRMGYKAWVSPKVRAYTDSMKTWKALRGQRMKWQTGTISDLLTFGVNRTTFVMWCQQALGWVSFLILLLFFTIMGITIAQGHVQYSGWGLVFSVGIPILVWLKNIKHSLRIPHRDNWDIAIAASLVIYEVFSWVRMAWFISAWRSVLWEKVSRKKKDRWAMQYASESGGTNRVSSRLTRRNAGPESKTLVESK